MLFSYLIFLKIDWASIKPINYLKNYPSECFYFLLSISIYLFEDEVAAASTTVAQPHDHEEFQGFKTLHVTGVYQIKCITNTVIGR